MNAVLVIPFILLNSFSGQFTVMAGIKRLSHPSKTSQEYLGIGPDKAGNGEHIKPLPEGKRFARNLAEADGQDVFEETVSQVYKKMPNLAIKFQPFELPANYNKFQIPSISYANARSKDFNIDAKDLNFFNTINHEVSVTIRILDVNDVDEIAEEVIFSASLILQWKDEVIAIEGRKKFQDSDEGVVDTELTANPDSERFDEYFKTLDKDILTKIWKPDIFIERLVKVKNPELMSEAVTVRINEVTGVVVYASRVRIQMECEMDLHFYPADTQSCQVLLRSHSYSNDELTLAWAQPFGAMLEDCGGKSFYFQLGHQRQTTRVDGYIGASNRSYSALKFNILARRKLSYHLVQTFLPSVFFIIITWLCFLIPSTMVEARVGISMTTLLTLTAMFASIRESTPTVSYVRAIDIWMLACIFFVFLTLLEFTALVWLHSTRTSIRDKWMAEINAGGGENTTLQVDFKNSNLSPKKQKQSIKIRREDVIVPLKIRASEFIEKYAFFIFSAIFIIFNVVYWTWLLTASNYYEWHVDTDYNFCHANHVNDDE